MKTQTNTEATARPWKTTGALIFRQLNPGGRKSYIADCSMDVGASQTIANAALICIAVNLFEAHEAVAKAAKAYMSPDLAGVAAVEEGNGFSA